jgi:hypothetical protein
MKIKKIVILTFQYIALEGFRGQGTSAPRVVALEGLVVGLGGSIGRGGARPSWVQDGNLARQGVYLCKNGARSEHRSNSTHSPKTHLWP